MKASDLIEAIEKFFLDLIGTVIPGFALLVGLSWIWSKPAEIGRHLPLLSDQQFRWIILLGLSYVSGYALASIGENLIVDVLGWMKDSRLGKKVLPDLIISDKKLSDKIKDDPTFLAFKKEAPKQLPSLSSSDAEKMSVGSWRSIAMSIAPEDRQLVYRFMFISLLNLGMATSLLLLTFLWWLLAILNHFNVGGLGQIANPWYSFLLLLASLPFLERRYQFHKTAMEVPFSMVIAELGKTAKRDGNGKRAHDGASRDHPPAKIYLAGGFISGWQDRVKLAVPEFSYLDPRSHGLSGKAEYAAWDLQAIQCCDCVFAYLEATNPGGYALALEVGFARALGRFVILIDEKFSSDVERAQYFDMVGEASDVVFKTLQEGIDFLQTYKTLA